MGKIAACADHSKWTNPPPLVRINDNSSALFATNLFAIAIKSSARALFCWIYNTFSSHNPNASEVV